jgi:hypothetical protein
MHPFAAKFLTENFGVLLFGKHENLKVPPLPGHRVSVTRQGEFALAAKISDFVILCPDAILFRKSYPVRRTLLCRAEDAPVRVQRKRRSIGPMTLFVPGYFLRCSPTSWSRSAHRPSTLASIRSSSRPRTGSGCLPAEGHGFPSAAAGFGGACDRFRKLDASGGSGRPRDEAGFFQGYHHLVDGRGAGVRLLLR